MPELRTLLHLLLALALSAQGALPAFAAGSACVHGTASVAVATDESAPPCHDGAVERATATYSDDDCAGDCCGYAACDCVCVLALAVAATATVSPAFPVPASPPTVDVSAPATLGQSPANRPPIA